MLFSYNSVVTSVVEVKARASLFCQKEKRRGKEGEKEEGRGIYPFSHWLPLPFSKILGPPLNLMTTVFPCLLQIYRGVVMSAALTAWSV